MPESASQFGWYRGDELPLSFEKTSKKGWSIVRGRAVLAGDTYEIEFRIRPSNAQQESVEGFRALAQMPPERRTRLLEALAEYPIDNELFPPTGREKKRPRGRNNFVSQQAWFTARRFAPLVLTWVESAIQKPNALMRSIQAAFKKEGYPRPTAKRLAAYLVQRNFTNRAANQVYPGTAPMTNPRKFFQKVRKGPVPEGLSELLFKGTWMQRVLPKLTEDPNVAMRLFVQGILRGECILQLHPIRGVFTNKF